MSEIMQHSLDFRQLFGFLKRTPSFELYSGSFYIQKIFFLNIKWSSIVRLDFGQLGPIQCWKPNASHLSEIQTGLDLGRSLYRQKMSILKIKEGLKYT